MYVEDRAAVLQRFYVFAERRSDKVITQKINVFFFFLLFAYITYKKYIYQNVLMFYMINSLWNIITCKYEIGLRQFLDTYVVYEQDVTNIKLWYI